MIRNNIIQFPVYQTVKYILSAFSVQKHTILSAFSMQKHIILSAFSNKTNCKVTEILLFMQIYFALFGNLAHFYLGTWQNFVWAVGSWLIYLFGLNDFFFYINTLRYTCYKNIYKSRVNV